MVNHVIDDTRAGEGENIFAPGKVGQGFVNSTDPNARIKSDEGFVRVKHPSLKSLLLCGTLYTTAICTARNEVWVAASVSVKHSPE